MKTTGVRPVALARSTCSSSCSLIGAAGAGGVVVMCPPGDVAPPDGGRAGRGADANGAPGAAQNHRKAEVRAKGGAALGGSAAHGDRRLVWQRRRGVLVGP